MASQCESQHGGAVGNVQRQLREWWSKAASMKKRQEGWAVDTFRELSKEADACAETGA